MLGLPFDRPFADQAALAIEARITATRAEGFSWTGDRLGHFRATARIAAVVPQLGNELGQIDSPGNKKPALRGLCGELTVRFMRRRPE
jgi:hypothetical protein